MMSRFTLRAALLATALLASSAANAQLFRAYLAINGNDANPCTLPAPCRLLPAALNAVASGGEIWMLDSANYNTATVNITKSVKILAVPGAVGSVVAVGGPAISIATAGVDVSLRNLVIVPLPGGGGSWGVLMTAGNSLTVEQSLLTGLTGGIYVNTPAKARVVDSTIRVSGDGIYIRDGGRATVTRCVISSGQYALNVYGELAGTTTTMSVSGSTIEGGDNVAALAWSLNAAATVKLSLADSHLDRNFIGVYAQSAAGAPVTLTVSDSVITNSPSSGIAAWGTGAKVWAAGNTVTDNAIGLYTSNGGVIESAGNNAVRNNGTDQSATVTVHPMK